MTRFGARSILVIALIASIVGGVASYEIRAATQRAEAQVRVVAQRLEGGVIEFGVQHRQDDGGWGERILPRKNRMQADGTLNRWLSSTPVDLQVEVEIDPVTAFGLAEYAPVERHLTVAEYIDMCSSSADEPSEDLYEEGVTWGEYADGLRPIMMELQKIGPPVELREYHQASIGLVALLLGLANQHPVDELLNPWEVVGGVLAGLALISEAQENLDPMLRQRMIEAGCISAADSEEPEDDSQD